MIIVKCFFFWISLPLKLKAAFSTSEGEGVFSASEAESSVFCL